jgi:16S rRNA (cytosine1407-C5)-methyltransferase
MTRSTLERYRHLLSPDDFAQLEAATQRPLPPAIRVNTLKIDIETARRSWPEWHGWNVQPVPFCAAGWQIVEGGDNLSRTIEHRLGFYYIQDAASMLPAEQFRYDVERPLVLDMAASPGGKTTHLVSKTNDRGLVIANDTSRARIAALRSNLQDWGAINAAITNFPGERFGAWFPETFDAVLLDAPCSGESLRAAERRRPRPVSVKEREQLHQRQVRLLTSALYAAKPGGQIVYATCTLAPEENEAVLDALLQLHSQQVEIESADRVLPHPAPGLVSDGTHTFHPQVRNAIRLWPHVFDTSGFFAASIRKRDAIPAQPQALPTRAATKLERIARNEQSQVIDAMRQEFGFDLGALLDRQELGLVQRQGRIYAVPERFLRQFADLPYSAAGMLIGEWNERFAPSHEFLARFSAQCRSRRWTLPDDQTSKWLAGYDLRGMDDLPYPTGTVIIVQDSRGRYLGRAKVLRDRLRNLLPKK